LAWKNQWRLAEEEEEEEEEEASSIAVDLALQLADRLIEMRPFFSTHGTICPLIVQQKILGQLGQAARSHSFHL
jgi:hypothetical protein